MPQRGCTSTLVQALLQAGCARAGRCRRRGRTCCCRGSSGSSTATTADSRAGVGKAGALASPPRCCGRRLLLLGSALAVPILQRGRGTCTERWFEPIGRAGTSGASQGERMPSPPPRCPPCHRPRAGSPRAAARCAASACACSSSWSPQSRLREGREGCGWDEARHEGQLPLPACSSEKLHAWAPPTAGTRGGMLGAHLGLGSGRTAGRIAPCAPPCPWRVCGVAQDNRRGRQCSAAASPKGTEVAAPPSGWHSHATVVLADPVPLVVALRIHELGAAAGNLRAGQGGEGHLAVPPVSAVQEKRRHRRHGAGPHSSCAPGTGCCSVSAGLASSWAGAGLLSPRPGASSQGELPILPPWRQWGNGACPRLPPLLLLLLPPPLLLPLTPVAGLPWRRAAAASRARPPLVGCVRGGRGAPLRRLLGQGPAARAAVQARAGRPLHPERSPRAWGAAAGGQRLEGQVEASRGHGTAQWRAQRAAMLVG